MSTDPDLIRADIERTRASLSDDVNALADEVNPRNVMRRKTQWVTGAISSVKESVMGSASHAQETAGDAARSLGDAAANAPEQLTRRTQGNPLAAGLIAFGLGALVSSLIPATDRERSLAAEAKDKAQPLVDETRQIAQDAASELKEPAQQAAEAVKQSATDAATTVKDESRSAASDVRDDAR
jgi:hypothetical protein